MRWEDLEQQACSIARTLSVIGDRWTLMILRDCFMGIRRFEAFRESLGITRHLLSARLKKLAAAGVLERRAYQDHPVRYEYRLTGKGRDLYPVIMGLVHWGDTHMSTAAGRPVLHEHLECGATFDPVTTCSECGKPVDPRQVRLRAGPGASKESRVGKQAAG